MANEPGKEEKEEESLIKIVMVILDDGTNKIFSAMNSFDSMRVSHNGVAGRE